MAKKYALERPPGEVPVNALPTVPGIPSGTKIDFAGQLNPQQFEAVTAPPGPSLIIAGAGSGKTRTLTYRVAYLVENGVLPSSILLLTFTNKAAREMLDRVADLIPHDLTGLWGGTFHSIGNRLLRRHPDAVGLSKGFSIMDREDQEAMLKGVIHDVAGRNPSFPKANVLADVFSLAANTGRPVSEILLWKYPYFAKIEGEVAQVWIMYDEHKRRANTVDFDDLLEKTVLMLRNHEPLLQRYQKAFQFILVDEYQDTNKVQADFIDLLAGHHRNVTVVGDDAQGIYSWRGADFQNIIDFPKRYPGTRLTKIEINYRSTPGILALANAAIGHNREQYPKNLSAARPEGKMPIVVELNDSREQALFVGQRIAELEREGVELNEIAVLYRAHYHSMEVQMELTRRGVGFQLTSGLRFFEQAHIKDVAAFLRLAVNPRDEVSFLRAVRLIPKVGERTADSLWTQYRDLFVDGEQAAYPTEALLALKAPASVREGWTQFVHTMTELVDNGQVVRPATGINIILEAVYEQYASASFENYEQRSEDLRTLVGFASQFQDTQEFLDQLALLNTAETQTALDGDTAAPTVTLSSVHQAKGLEWKVVFVVWLTQAGFPSYRSMEEVKSMEEERRLFYVAVTRARDELYLTWPRIRLGGGPGETFQLRSQFLDEIPDELVECWEV